jgi:aspartate racemase
MEKRTPCFGLIGGLGIAATVRYYEALAAARNYAKKPLSMFISHADVTHVFELVQQGDLDSLASYLAEFLRRLEWAGATFAALPAVLPHVCFSQLSLRSPLPLISLLDVVRQEIRRLGLTRVAIFGTRTAVQTNLFGSLGHLDVLKPTSEEIERLHNMYSSLVLNGHGSVEIREHLLNLARVMIEREKAQAIILAGTDFSVIFNEHNTPFPAIDCADLHIQAIVRAME